MCLSNLPIEFDENGDPHLAEDAEEIRQPSCDCSADVAIDETDPRRAYDAIIDELPADVRAQLGDRKETNEERPMAEGE